MAGGLTIGLIASLWAADLVAGLVFGVTTTEPWIYAASVACLLLAGLVAVVSPVARALGVQPIEALRYE
jgi:ABC-type antimicrobial peptide transport system permease subunit